METFDYVIRNKEFGSYCAYNHDFEYEGWYLTSLNEALGFDTIEDALEELDKDGLNRKDYIICKRTMNVEVVHV
ncbi:hypothetical protein PP425_gp291 [Enterobacter phage vB_EclM_Q7622]|uniref:hypothetical protein n=1 Tax=Enterobacter phage vB_EclM_Q7622 TaxID=2908628 RepID=UPI0023291F7B|nr:hypothetical protein PP425_gp291 [Enterobacter phage vB_EclM_Q7622]UIS65676.1 hypothetical protein Q76222_00169 [Enterobacter phage vB_EclM_Q7622]